GCHAHGFAWACPSSPIPPPLLISYLGPLDARRNLAAASIVPAAGATDPVLSPAPAALNRVPFPRHPRRSAAHSDPAPGPTDNTAPRPNPPTVRLNDTAPPGSARRASPESSRSAAPDWRGQC